MSGIEGEAKLWAEARDGDAAAFGALFDQHRNRVYRHAVFQLGVREDAEDAAAAAFLELWRRRSTVRLVDESVLPWLLVTTSNMCRNVARARRRYSELLDRIPRERAGDYEAELLAQSRLDAERQMLLAFPALKRLSEADRALLILTTVEDLPVTTVAEALGLFPGAARTRLHRIKAKLRDQIEMNIAEEVKR